MLKIQLGRLDAQWANRLGNVVIGFSMRLQIDPMLFCTGRYVRHGRFASKHSFAFPKVLSKGVSHRKHDNCDDHPKYVLHCTLHHRGFLCRRRRGLLRYTSGMTAPRAPYRTGRVRSGKEKRLSVIVTLQSILARASPRSNPCFLVRRQNPCSWCPLSLSRWVARSEWVSRARSYSRLWAMWRASRVS